MWQQLRKGTGMKEKTRYIREQRAVCGPDYMEVDYYWVSQAEHRASTRAKRRAASSLAQKKRNAARASRYFVQLVNTNFDANGFSVVLTYDDAFLPDMPEQADGDLSRYIRRVQAFCRKKGWAAPRWVAVTEWQPAGNGCKAVRYHHHLLLQVDGLTKPEQWELRARLEALWHQGGEPMGTVNADALQPERDNLEGLARYMTKYVNRKHRWRTSRGLKKPVYPRPNDTKMSARRLHQACTLYVDDAAHWEACWPGYRFCGAEPRWDEVRAQWQLTVKMRRRPARPQRTPRPARRGMSAAPTSPAGADASRLARDLAKKWSM